MIYGSTHIDAEEFMYEFINTYLLGAKAQVKQPCFLPFSR